MECLATISEINEEKKEYFLEIRQQFSPCPLKYFLDFWVLIN